MPLHDPRAAPASFRDLVCPAHRRRGEDSALSFKKVDPDQYPRSQPHDRLSLERVEALYLRPLALEPSSGCGDAQTVLREDKAVTVDDCLQRQESTRGKERREDPAQHPRRFVSQTGAEDSASTSKCAIEPERNKTGTARLVEDNPVRTAASALRVRRAFVQAVSSNHRSSWIGREVNRGSRSPC